MIIRELPFAKLEAEYGFAALVEEYYTEAGNPGLPRPKYDSAQYRKLCQLGLMHTFAAMSDGVLLGFMMLIVTELPKYSLPMTQVETIFVGKAYRMSGAGVRLLKQAETLAAARGCPGLLVSTPAEGALADVLPRLGYVESNRIYFRQVARG